VINSLQSKVIVITGSNSGIGFGLVERAIEISDDTNSWKTGYTKIFACCRKPDEAKNLLDLQQTNKNIILVKLDLAQEQSIREASEFIASRTNKIDVLFNNGAAMLLDTPEDHVTLLSNLTESFQVNCVGTLSFTKHLIPLVKASSGKRIINITSAAGSIGNTRGGGSPGIYSYKISKAALNMASALLAAELKNDNVIVIALNPGGVITRTSLTMGASEATGWMKPEVATTKMMRIIDALTMAESGQFINHRYLDENDKEYKTFYP